MPTSSKNDVDKPGCSECKHWAAELPESSLNGEGDTIKPTNFSFWGWCQHPRMQRRNANLTVIGDSKRDGDGVRTSHDAICRHFEPIVKKKKP